MLSVSSSPDPITSRRLRPRSAALRLSQLGAGYARLPQWGRETFPKPHPYLDSSRCFVSNQPVAKFRVNLSEARQCIIVQLLFFGRALYFEQLSDTIYRFLRQMWARFFRFYKLAPDMAPTSYFYRAARSENFI